MIQGLERGGSAREDGGGMEPGLCASCRWARRVVSGRGSVFWLCERSRVDGRFRKYPALPVRACAGYEQEGQGETGGALDKLR